MTAGALNVGALLPIKAILVSGLRVEGILYCRKKPLVDTLKISQEPVMVQKQSVRHDETC